MDKFPATTKLQEPFSKLFEKATSLFGLSTSGSKAPVLDGEIVYSKNNVCVHSNGSKDPVPGYLSLRCSKVENQANPTLILHWVPNVTIKKNPQSLDSPVGSSSKNSSSAQLSNLDDAAKTYGQEDTKQNNELIGNTGSEELTEDENTRISNKENISETERETVKSGSDSNQAKRLTQNEHNEKGDEAAFNELPDEAATLGVASQADDHLLVDGISVCNINDDTSPELPSTGSSVLDTSTSSADFCYDRDTIISMTSSSDEDEMCNVSTKAALPNTGSPHKRPLSLSVSSYATGPLSPVSLKVTADIENSSSDSSTGCLDSPQPISPSGLSDLSSMCDIISLTATAEMIADSRRKLQPAASDVISNSEQIPSRPSVFSVNLGVMRSLRLFFAEGGNNCGQLVIASRESQYKIFHFNNGGLDKLAELLQDWNLFRSPRNKPWNKVARSSLTHFFPVVKPKARDEEEFHPEQSLYQKLDAVAWKALMNSDGQIADEVSLKKMVFFGGIESSLRREVWPFLLHYYPYDSTYKQREEIRRDKLLRYEKICLKRRKLSMNEAWRARFWRSVQNTVEKDVVRTDRAHQFYKGDGNTNVEKLKEILLNYAVAHPHLGYTQGMSDLLSPVLVQIENESDAYWCFVGLMQRTIFNSRPKDLDMDKQLLYLKELLRLMQPKFYQHLMKVGEAEGLLFVHRWVLLCFKREFVEEESLTIWETCWANIQTDYFHLFIATAIIELYTDDVLTEDLPSDEMLLHFSSLAHNMQGQAILAKARTLMHQFRLLETLPCTLQNLCSTCSVGMWDSGHVPAVQCIGHDSIDGCPYMGVSSQPPNMHGIMQ